MHALIAAALSLFFAVPPRWQLITAPVPAGLRGLSVVSSRTVWTSGTGGTVLRTTDGGAHWSLLPVRDSQSLDFRDVEAFSDRRAVIMSSGPGSRSAVFLTEDGGGHWLRTLLNPDPQGFFDAVAFNTPRHGFLVGDPVGGHFAFFETDDGGATWHRLLGPEALPGESLFAASGTCLAVSQKSEVWIATGGVAARVLRSNDAGRTWTNSLVPILHGKPSTGIFSISANLGGRLDAVGGDYTHPDSTEQTAALSLDHGIHWQAVTGLGGYRSSLTYVRGFPEVRIAVGTNGSDLSTDNGRTWRRFSQFALNSVASEPGGRGVWAVGPNGRIARLLP